MRRLVMSLALSFLLAACGAAPTWAPDEAVARAAYREPGPDTLTLYTVVNNRSNDGAHSALMINADERVLFDPAGSWHNRHAPERNDVHYGITPRILDIYIDYHARETFRVIEQEITVTPEVAAQIKRAAEAYGAVPRAMCTTSISTILAQAPGFSGIGRTMFPTRLSSQFEALPGVRTRVIYDDDSDDNSAVLAAND